MTGCYDCDINGPWLDVWFGWNREWQEFHRAAHDLGRILIAELWGSRFFLAFVDRLDRIARKAGF